MNVLSRKMSNFSGKTARVTVTGAAGAIGYALLFRIASGAFLGSQTKIHLNLLEIPQGMNALKGVEMELRDCAFPLVSDITCTDDSDEAFDGCDFAFLVGAKPRSKGMERGDLLEANANIFTAQGKSINKGANRDSFKAIVVGNPANTNALIAAASAPNIDPTRFSAMTRLDHNRGLSQLSAKLNCGVTDISNFMIWGNHSATQYPDIHHASVNGKAITDLVDQEWNQNTFIPDVQQRGAAIIAARGASSAASAASSAIDHMRDWELGLPEGEVTSMAVYSDGSDGYGIAEGIYYSFPVTCKNGNYEIVKGLDISAFSQERMSATEKELLEEKAAVAHLLP